MDWHIAMTESQWDMDQICKVLPCLSAMWTCWRWLSIIANCVIMRTAVEKTQKKGLKYHDVMLMNGWTCLYETWYNTIMYSIAMNAVIVARVTCNLWRDMPSRKATNYVSTLTQNGRANCMTQYKLNGQMTVSVTTLYVPCLKQAKRRRNSVFGLLEWTHV